MTPLIYLAVPYTHPDPSVRFKRFCRANNAAAWLMEHNYFVFSPISHTHPIALAGNLPTDWKYWKGYDERMISLCTAVLVLEIPGWQKSVGVTNEIRIAKELNVPVFFRTPATIHTFYKGFGPAPL